MPVTVLRCSYKKYAKRGNKKNQEMLCFGRNLFADDTKFITNSVFGIYD